MKATIVVLAGDGIGPEVTAEAVRVLQKIAEEFRHEFTFTERQIGGISIDASGTPLTEETLATCKSADAVLLGAVGGPKWDNPNAPTRPEDGLLALRKGLGLYANLRPVKPHPALVHASPIKPEKLQDVDLIVVRELTGGLYFGQPKGRQRVDGHVRAVDTLEYHDYEIERILRLAFQLSRHRRKKLTSVDKANVLETSRLWRQTANTLAAENPDIVLDHMLVDTASMRLISSPGHFDVLVTENMFGDILTDEASVLAGSMGLLPSASLGDGGLGLYEPIHGSAPDIAGKGIANPVGAILSAAMLLRHSLHLEREAAAVESAVEMALAQGYRTVDLGGKLKTQEMANRIIERVSTD
ncbi:MAG: 3-isopropylmalate dehydrogenase [Bacteroidota bacterium]